MYIYSYDPHFCNFIEDCERCNRRLECLHYVPRTNIEEEGFEANEEYRLYVENLDNNKEKLIRTYVERWKKFGIPEDECELIVRLCYLSNWKLKDCEVVLREKGVLYLERLLTATFKDLIIEYLEEKIESGLEEELEVLEWLEVFKKEGDDLTGIPAKMVRSLVAEMMTRNFTGEVRVGPLQNEEDSPEASPWPWGSFWALGGGRYLKNIILSKSGKRAYYYSMKVKELMRYPFDYEEKERLKKCLNKAWEARRALSGLSLEEKLEKYREITGWTF